MEPIEGFQQLSAILTDIGIDSVPRNSSDSATRDSTADTAPDRLQVALAALQAAAELAPYQPTLPPCPICGDLGAVIVASDGGRPRYQRCECRVRADREEWIAQAGTPPFFADLDFDTYRSSRGADLGALAQVQDWVTRGSGSLLLFGAYGSMKTGLACSAMRARIRLGQRALFITAAELLAELRASFDHSAGGLRPSELIERVQHVPLLVLDELGGEQIPRDAGWLQEVFYRVIGHRHDFERPMLLTTNLGMETGAPITEIAARLGKRTGWRLTEMVGPNVIRVGGANQRKGGEV